MHFLDFEKPIADLEAKIKELSLLTPSKILDNKEIFSLKKEVDSLLEKTYNKLTPWQITQVARHPERPHSCDYIEELIDNFQILSGDRTYGEDKAIIAGIGSLENHSVMVIGQEKGSDTESRVIHNFGMASPEGYRKVARLFKLADKFKLPIITLVDTAGAYPGVGAEERGQAEAIAKCIATSLEIKVPIISVIIGEGGSGGAVALATGNRILMLQNSIYSVISPEGCASILWRDDNKAKLAADALSITAEMLKNRNIIDSIIEEPLGGAHRDHKLTIKNVKISIIKSLEELINTDPKNILDMKKEKFLGFGRL